MYDKECFVVSDEEINYYGDKYQSSLDKKEGVSFEVYMKEEVKEKTKRTINLRGNN